MAVNSGWESKITWEMVFPRHIAEAVFGEHADYILQMLTDKDRDLEDHTVQPEAIFSWFGPLAVAVSGPWVNRIGGYLVEVTCVLKTAGSGSSVVTVYKNGISIGTVTIPSGATTATQAFQSVPFNVGVDKMSVGITTAGAAADSLTAHGRFV